MVEEAEERRTNKACGLRKERGNMFRTILLQGKLTRTFAERTRQTTGKIFFSNFKQFRQFPKKRSPTFKFLKYGSLSGFGLMTSSHYLHASGQQGNGRNDILNNFGGYQLSDTAGAITVGAVSGFFAGFVAKKIGTIALFVVGTIGIVFQLAASAGYIEIKWDKIEKKTQEVIDEAQKEADGIDLNKPDAFINKKLAPMVLGHVAPTGGGFAAGFFLGVRF